MFNYLSELSNKHVHRSCSMTRIHYPVEIQTTQDQQDVKGGTYLKKPYEITCHNNPSLPAQAPYIWDAANTTCRDWKLRYCCENMWGEPALYQLVSQKAKEDKTMKVIPRAISEQLDMFFYPSGSKPIWRQSPTLEFDRPRWLNRRKRKQRAPTANRVGMPTQIGHPSQIHIPTGVCEENTPPEKNTLWNIGFKSIEAGAG